MKDKIIEVLNFGARCAASHEGIADAILAIVAEGAEPVAWGVFCRVDGDFVLQHPVRFSHEDAEADATRYEHGTELVVRPLYTTPPNVQALQARVAELEGALHDQHQKLIDATQARDEAVSAVQRLTSGESLDAVVVADTVKRMTSELTEKLAAAEAREVKLRMHIEEADGLLDDAWGAMLKMGLRGRGSDCTLPHEVRMFALHFSAEGREGPGALQVTGDGSFLAWRDKIRGDTPSDRTALDQMLAEARAEEANKWAKLCETNQKLVEMQRAKVAEMEKDAALLEFALSHDDYAVVRLGQMYDVGATGVGQDFDVLSKQQLRDAMSQEVKG